MIPKFVGSNDFTLLVFLYLNSTLLSKLFPSIFFLQFPPIPGSLQSVQEVQSNLLTSVPDGDIWLYNISSSWLTAGRISHAPISFMRICPPCSAWAIQILTHSSPYGKRWTKEICMDFHSLILEIIPIAHALGFQTRTCYMAWSSWKKTDKSREIHE